MITTDTYRPPVYQVGIDLGKRHDWTALAVLKQRQVPTGRVRQVEEFTGYGAGTRVSLESVTEQHYDLVHLDRWRGRKYRDVVPEVNTTIQHLRQIAYQEYFDATGIGAVGRGEPAIDVLVDRTGVGEAVIEDLRAAGLACVGILIHGGDTVHAEDPDDEVRVPKRELVGALQVVLENQRLHIAQEMALADVLVQEMENFRATIKLSGADTYGAGEDWREGNHDDLVLAVAMAVWFGEHMADRRRAAEQFGRDLDAYWRNQ